MTKPDKMSQLFLDQAQACDRLGSAFTAGLLTSAASWLGSDGPIAKRLMQWPGQGVNDAVPLRLAGAIHALVLSGKSPDLKPVYDGLGSGDCPDFGDVWPIMAAAIKANSKFVDRFLDNPPQTNEVGRAAMLMAASHELAARFPMPFHLLEAGASAGLNLAFDRFGYQLGDLAAGPKDATPGICPDWRGETPPATEFSVVARHGCDVAPLDVNDADDRLRLNAYVWADQAPRLARLRHAIATLRDTGVTVDRSTIGNWLEEQLPCPRPGVLTLLFHTIVWQYLPPYEVALAEAHIRKAGDAATKSAPFARLAMEWNPGLAMAEVRLTTWPGGEERLVGFSHAHGDWIEWKGWA